MKILRVSGSHNSGKTTVVEAILKGLRKRGYSVSTVKDIHIDGWTIDHEGKDTRRHADAGSSAIGILAPEETVVIFPGQQKTVEQLFSFFETDFLVLEGFLSRIEVPGIICAKTEEEIRQVLAPGIFCISGLISERFPDSFAGIPVINALRNGEMIVDLVERWSKAL